MQVIVPDSSCSRSQPRRCAFDGCGSATKEGKPYCTSHVEHNAYAKYVILMLEQRVKDDSRAAKSRRRSVNVRSITATEILKTVSDRVPRTRSCLCKDLNIDAAVLDGYISALFKEGKITLGRTRKGAETVSLAT